VWFCRVRTQFSGPHTTHNNNMPVSMPVSVASMPVVRPSAIGARRRHYRDCRRRHCRRSLPLALSSSPSSSSPSPSGSLVEPAGFRSKLRTALTILFSETGDPNDREAAPSPSPRDVAKDRLRCTLTFDRSDAMPGEIDTNLDASALDVLSERVQSVMSEFVELPMDGNPLVDVKQRVEGNRKVYSLSFRVARVKPNVDAGLRELGEEQVWSEAMSAPKDPSADELPARFRDAVVSWDHEPVVAETATPLPAQEARARATKPASTQRRSIRTPPPRMRSTPSRDSLEQELWGDFARPRSSGPLSAVGGLPGALSAIAAGLAAYSLVAGGISGGWFRWFRGGNTSGNTASTTPSNLPVTVISERTVPKSKAQPAPQEEQNLSRRERRQQRAEARRAAREAARAASE